MWKAILCLLLGITLAAGFGAGAALAAPGDTTTVRTFDQEFINWATPIYANFNLPSDPANVSQITMYVTIDCPTAPGDCDPWDRVGNIRVVTADQGDVEVARFVTPYDITIPGGPGSCTWQFDGTPYKTLLHDDVELRLYIESWIGGDRGWLITLDFEYIEGTLDPEPYKVVNLWQDDWIEYGNPDDPLSDYIQSMNVDIPLEATSVEFRGITTGHGQGNTGNCAEFCPKNHSLVADGTTFSHLLWRSNCAANPCGPQGGTWTLNRAGWCPGNRVKPWTVDVTSAVTPGTQATFEYLVDPYENLCRPGNPSCVNGVTCPDCDYNFTGHTVPIYIIQSHLVFYTDHATATSIEAARTLPGNDVRLEQNSPNPFQPGTRFEYSIPRPAEVEIEVYDLGGRRVKNMRRYHSSPGTFSATWDGRDMSGNEVAAGVYFYRLNVEGEIQTRKMVRLR